MQVDYAEFVRLFNSKDEQGIPFNYSQIATKLGVTRERVRQLALSEFGETAKVRYVPIKAAKDALAKKVIHDPASPIPVFGPHVAAGNWIRLLRKMLLRCGVRSTIQTFRSI